MCFEACAQRAVHPLVCNSLCPPMAMRSYAADPVWAFWAFFEFDGLQGLRRGTMHEHLLGQICESVFVHPW